MAIVINPTWVSKFSASKLTFYSNYLKEEELKEFDEFFAPFLKNKLVAELFEKALQANNGELNVGILDTYIATACWSSKNKTILLNLYKTPKFSALNETQKYSLKHDFLFELINAIHFADSVPHKNFGDFETADDYALYQEQEEYRTYCLHRDTLEQLKSQGFFPDDYDVPLKYTFDEYLKVVNQSLPQYYTLGTHIEAYRDRFREVKKGSETLMQEFKQLLDVRLLLFSNLYDMYYINFIQFAVNKTNLTTMNDLSLSVEALKETLNEILALLQEQNNVKSLILPKADKELLKNDLIEKIQLFNSCKKLMDNFAEVLKKHPLRLMQDLKKVEESLSAANKVNGSEDTNQPQTQNQGENRDSVLLLGSTMELLKGLFKDQTVNQECVNIFFELNQMLSKIGFIKIKILDPKIKESIVHALCSSPVDVKDAMVEQYRGETAGQQPQPMGVLGSQQTGSQQKHKI